MARNQPTTTDFTLKEVGTPLQLLSRSHVTTNVWRGIRGTYEVAKRLAESQIFDRLPGIERFSLSLLRVRRYSLRLYMTRAQWEAVPDQPVESAVEFCRAYMEVRPAHRHTLGLKPYDATSLLDLMALIGEDLTNACRRYFLAHPIAVDEAVRIGNEAHRITAVEAKLDDVVVHLAGLPIGEPTQTWSEPAGRLTIRVWTE